MSEETRSDVYAELAAVGPYGVHPGHALITMVEPHPGHEYAYNRWYEDDHYYAGAMAMPWMYAGRRWVATRELQELRYPQESAVARPVRAGCYLSTAGSSWSHPSSPRCRERIDTSVNCAEGGGSRALR